MFVLRNLSTVLPLK